MNEEHKKWLRRIEILLDEFEDDQTQERLRLVSEELRKLCIAVAGTGYTGIDLTILRFLRFEVREGLGGLLNAKAQPTVIAADSLRLRSAINRMLSPAMAVMRSAAATAPQQSPPGAAPQSAQELPKAVAPVVTLAKITYCVGDGCFWDANSPDSTYRLTSPVHSLIVLREAGLKKVRWLRVETPRLCCHRVRRWRSGCGRSSGSWRSRATAAPTGRCRNSCRSATRSRWFRRTTCWC